MLHIHQSFSNATRLKRLGACRWDDSWRSCATLLGSVENLRTPTKSVRQLANLPAQPQLRTAKRHNSSWFISYCSWFSPPFFVQVQLSTGEATEQGFLMWHMVSIHHCFQPVRWRGVLTCPQVPLGSLRPVCIDLNHQIGMVSWALEVLLAPPHALNRTCMIQEQHDFLGEVHAPRKKDTCSVVKTQS